jgi:predicted nucleotidyltransferase
MDQTTGAFTNVLGELAQRGLLPSTRSAVFVGGSLARGWAHARSDMDIVVIAPEPWSSATSTQQSVWLTVPTIQVEVITVAGRRWEIKYWLTSQVEEAMAKVDWEAFEKNGPPSDLGIYETFTLERMCHGIAIDGAAWFAEHRAAVRDSALNSIIALQHLAKADSALEDMVGLREAGEERDAVVPARNAFGFAVDALNASRGEAGLEPKWRPKRVALLNHPCLPLERYWELELCVGLDPRNPGPWLDEVALTCGRLFLDTNLGRPNT